MAQAAARAKRGNLDDFGASYAQMIEEAEQDQIDAARRALGIIR
jgi:hypothetical protein